MLTYERIKAIEESLGPQAHAVISALQDRDKRIEEQKSEVKQDLLVELATKADIATLAGDIRRLEALTKADIATLGGDIRQLEPATKTDIQQLSGDMKANIATLAGEIKRVEERLGGEIKRLETLIKILIGLAVAGMALFSPVAAELIRLLK